jgi:3-hydroxyisobutyrate dehydrogenase-like beta-hydroxyacid dehydrogenase
MLESAARAGQRLPLSETHRELLELAERLDLGALDNSAILRAIEAQRLPPGPQ